MAFAMLVLIATAVAVVALWTNGTEDYFRTGSGAEDVGATRRFATFGDGESRTSVVEREAVRQNLAQAAFANVRS